MNGTKKITISAFALLALLLAFLTSCRSSGDTGSDTTGLSPVTDSLVVRAEPSADWLFCGSGPYQLQAEVAGACPLACLEVKVYRDLDLLARPDPSRPLELRQDSAGKIGTWFLPG